MGNLSRGPHFTNVFLWDLFLISIVGGCFWRSRYRAIYAGVFLVVAALEFYGTAIGTWRWAAEVPILGIPDGNPPSGVASGYIWFDVMALLLAPMLVPFVRVRARRKPTGGERPPPMSTHA